jgi:hypothetical protein
MPIRTVGFRLNLNVFVYCSGFIFPQVYLLDKSGLEVEPGYKETPRFQGIKSSCPSRTAFGITSPLAALIQYSKISSPIC